MCKLHSLNNFDNGSWSAWQNYILTRIQEKIIDSERKDRKRSQGKETSKNVEQENMATRKNIKAQDQVWKRLRNGRTENTKTHREQEYEGRREKPKKEKKKNGSFHLYT